jgi:hypothetical protein
MTKLRCSPWPKPGFGLPTKDTKLLSSAKMRDSPDWLKSALPWPDFWKRAVGFRGLACGTVLLVGGSGAANETKATGQGLRLASGAPPRFVMGSLQESRGRPWGRYCAAGAVGMAEFRKRLRKSRGRRMGLMMAV